MGVKIFDYSNTDKIASIKQQPQQQQDWKQQQQQYWTTTTTAVRGKN